jgi:hypothetical protein
MDQHLQLALHQEQANNVLSLRKEKRATGDRTNQGFHDNNRVKKKFSPQKKYYKFRNNSATWSWY